MYPGGAQRSWKRHKLALGLFCVALHTSSAFFFSLGPRKKSAVSPINATCESKAFDGDCEFYRCFNERHPCEDSKNYAINYGWKFCSRFDTHRNRLTEEGHRWLNGTRNCSMTRLLEIYREDAIFCDVVEEKMREKHAECEETNGLCSARLIADNKEVLADVYTLSLDSATQFLYSLEKCAATQVSGAVAWLRARFRDLQGTGQSILQSLLPIFGDVQGQVRQLGESVRGEIRGLGNGLQTLGSILPRTRSKKSVD